MKRIKKIRDLIYVNGNLEDKVFYYYGIEFYEFMNLINNRPNNLILLKHNFNDAKWHYYSRFDFVSEVEIDSLIEDNIYSYGDFCWIDFKNEEDLDNLSDSEIAELLLFAHLARPLNQDSFKKIMNRFAYYAHDDGWFNKLYVNNIDDFEILLSRVIMDKLRKFTKRKFSGLPKHLTSLLLDSTRKGLFIDFTRVQMNRTSVRVPFTTVGHFTDMDMVYDLRDEIDNYMVWLEYSKKNWTLIGDVRCIHQNNY